MKISTISKITSTIILLSSFMTLSEVTAQEYLAVAEAALQEGQEKYGLIESDIDQYILSDYHQSTPSGTHHHYFNQTYNGIKILNAVAGVHIMKDGKLLIENNRFKAKISNRINQPENILNPIRALELGGQEISANLSGRIELVNSEGGTEQKQTYRNESLSDDDITMKLIYFEKDNGDIRLGWRMYLNKYDQVEMWDIIIDAESGETIYKQNLVLSCSHADYGGTANFTPESGNNVGHKHTSKCNHSIKKKAKENTAVKKRSTSVMMDEKYRVYALPVESPAFGDRTLLTNPHLTIASPFGWHDTDGVAGAEDNLSRGNNVDAFAGYDTSIRANGGANLNFDFAIDTTWSASDRSINASITNCFYLNNRAHDLWYLYGFDEAAGNFQENNYGKGGLGGDRVNTRVQDPSSTCNGSWGTGPDGNNPTHWVYTCSSGSQTPAHDGAYDSGVMGHEFAHGISIRLVGGPSNSSGLNNDEQMGEGWSDYFGLMVSMLNSHAGSDGRGRGTWNYQQPPNGPGNRAFRYSTDMTVNPDTYDSIKNTGSPHRLGSVWCVMLWEMTWALIDEHGFTSNLEDDWDQAGNTLALQLVMDGMKLTPVSPGFVDARDAILAADQALTGGENQCIIWDAFAKRKLGAEADQGSSNDRNDGTEEGTITETYVLTKTVDKETAAPGDELTYTLFVDNSQAQTDDECENSLIDVVLSDTIPPNTTYVAGSASNGGSFSGGVVTWPVFSMLYPGSATRTFKVTVDGAYTPSADLVADDFENSLTDWTSSASDWFINTTEKKSGNHSVFANDISSQSVQTLTYNNTFVPDDKTVLSFWHWYDTENDYDGGIVEVSENGGNSWIDVGPMMIKNGYNGKIRHPYPNFSAGFSGNSNGFIETLVDLSSFDGKTLNVRFVLTTDTSVSGNGWFVDLVRVDKDHMLNAANARESYITYTVYSETVSTRVEEPCNDLMVTSTADAGLGSLRDIVDCASDGDIITFDPAINTQLIKLITGQITINKDISIIGNGIDNTIVDGSLDDASRLFEVAAGNTVHFEDMTFQNGGSATYNGFGGAIWTRGNTSILGCKFTGNNNSNAGCAILQNEGDLKIVNCEFSDNGLLSSGSSEAVIWKFGDADVLEIYQSVFFGNDVTAVIIVSDGTINNISQNTFVDNIISSRVASFQNNGTNTFSNNVIEETEPPLFLYGFASVTANNNISLSASGNLPVSQGNIVGSALLNPDYTLMSSSPAISAGDNASIPADILDLDNDGVTTEDLPQDYTGGARLQGCGSNIDIGAFEANDTGTGLVTNTNDDGYGSLRYEVECAASGTTITFDPAINGMPIQLTSGHILINKNLTIEGNGVNNTIVDGSLDEGSRLFRVPSINNVVHFEKMTMKKGGGSSFTGHGGCLASHGIVSMLEVNIEECTSTNYVGTIVQWSGDIKMVNCTFKDNSSTEGGNLECVFWKQGASSNLSIHQCIFTGNDVETLLIETGGYCDLSNNTISGNTLGQRCIQISSNIKKVNNNIINENIDAITYFNGAPDANNNISLLADSDLPAANNNIVGDPLLDTDFTIMSGSIAISAGDVNLIPADSLDIDGDGNLNEYLPSDFDYQDRVLACQVDLGAKEYTGNDMAIVVTNNNDSGPGSFRAALACAPTGSIITFDPITDGTPIVFLTGNLSPANNNITVKGNGTGQTILDGGNSDITLFILDSKMLIVEDLTVQKFGVTSKCLFEIVNGSFFRFYNSEVDDCGLPLKFHGIIFCNGSTVELENSTFSNIIGRAPYVFQSNSPNCIVKQCLFYNHTNNDYELLGNKNSSEVSYIQNTFSKITTGGSFDGIIKYESGANIDVFNNIFYGNTTTADVKNSGSGGIIAAGSNISEFPGDLPMGSYISVDPLFVNAATDNYKLSACSPAIGRGDPAQAPATDTEGHARPAGFGVDIGWDEYTGSACIEGQCSTAIEIDCGDTILADNYNGANNHSDYSNCNGAVLDGPERVYEITTTDVGDIIVSIISSGNIDLSLVLTDDCGNPLSCVSTNGNGGSMSIPSAAVGTYYIILDGQNAATGDMEFIVDAVCGHVPCSENIVMINTPEDPMGLYHAIDEIQSNTTINNDATYKAGNHIDLNEGFEVTAGQVFEAVIEPCPN